MSAKSEPADYAAYAKRFTADVQKLLQRMRQTIQKAAPKAQETISYGMPAFRQDGGILVWFAPHKNHIGFYPGASGIAAFAAELAQYKFAKGSVQFPIDEPLPLALIRRMVQFRVKERLAKQKKSPRSGRSV
jgi:uncharacterized protein YdhG (YjbR/CyaY superfamily)